MKHREIAQLPPSNRLYGEVIREKPAQSAEAEHLIVAFSDQMATPQTGFRGTLEGAKRAGRRFANQHLKRGKHSHRRLLILNLSTNQQVAVELS